MNEYQEALDEILFSASKLNDHIYACDDIFDEYVDCIISNANSLQELVDKEKLMKPLRTSGGSYICPNCIEYHFREVSKNMRYCSWCGQKLDWSDKQ